MWQGASTHLRCAFDEKRSSARRDLGTVESNI